MFGEDILIMIQAADAFYKNDHKRTPFLTNLFYIHAKALLDGLHAPHSKQDQEKFSAFALFLDTNIQQAKLMSHCTISLFISTVCPFDYGTRNKSYEWKEKAERRKKRLIVNAK